MGEDFVRAGRRRFESHAGLRALGVPLRRQIYLDIPDGALAESSDQIAKLITEAADGIGPDALFTTGVDGYDGHPDHITMHDAAIKAVAGQYAVWGLMSNHSGELRYGGNLQVKIAAMAMHGSQIVHPDMTRWGGTPLYTPLIITGETYAREGAV